MRYLRKKQIIMISLFVVLISSFSYAGDRGGQAAGIIVSSVSVENGWVGSLGANNTFKNTEAEALRWNFPIHWGEYLDGAQFDLSTDLAGWIILVAAGEKNDSPITPAFSDNKNYQYQEVNLVTARIAVELFDLGVPVLLGGQGSLGYMGIRAIDKTSANYYEQGSYVSYGANAGTSFELGEQFLRAYFMYDWISMGDEKTGNGWSIEVEYFPFSSKSALNFVRVKAFTKSTEMDYPKKLVNDTEYKYSSYQMGVGLIFNIPI